jgi:hypothetical protein
MAQKGQLEAQPSKQWTGDVYLRRMGEEPESALCRCVIWPYRQRLFVRRDSFADVSYLQIGLAKAEVRICTARLQIGNSGGSQLYTASCVGLITFLEVYLGQSEV